MEQQQKYGNKPKKQIVDNLGRIPPQAVELEQSVLGTILAYNMMPKSVSITSDMFYKEAHKNIFKSIENLLNRNVPIDILTCTNELKKMGLLESVGGPYYVTELTNRIGGETNLDYHAAIVVQKYMQRELIRISNENMNAAYDDSNDIFELLEQTETSIIEVKNKSFDKSLFSISAKDIKKFLAEKRLNTKQMPEQPQTIIAIREQIGNLNTYKYSRICTLGNFSMWIGKAKSKKTFLLSMVVGAMVAGHDENNVIYGYKEQNKSRIAIFDTEQGEYDSLNVIKRIETIAGNRKDIYAYNLREFSPHERCKIIEEYFKEYGESTLFCVIDGIADLATAINDEEEASRLGSLMLKLTKIYNCHIACVLHQNKGDNNATGHLGSYLLKKAEIIISVAKDAQNNSVSHVNCDFSRAAEFKPFSFQITNDGLPVVVTDKQAIKQESFSENAPF